MTKVLVVDDERSIRRTLREILTFENYEVEEAEDGLEAVTKVETTQYDVIIMDIKMPKLDGLEALEKIQNIAPDTPVIMISGHGTIETAVDAVKKGAFDYISKPPDLNRLLITVRNALDKSSLMQETKTLKKKINKLRVPPIIGETQSIADVKEQIERVAPTEARVLVMGPNGSGKELVARWIHEYSMRASGPLIEVNCAAIPSELIESELFGHEKGAFTSAIKQRLGKFELAQGGTLFLDEIGDMSLSAQAKVLRALQESRIVRVGGDKEIKVDVRVVAATNKDLRREIDAKRFREDLYHRLAVIVINVPSLKERCEDVPMLVEHFIDLIADEYGTPPKRVTQGALDILKTLDWTGNIRELRNVVERLIILSREQITEQDVKTFVLPMVGKQNILHEIFERYGSLEDIQYFIRKEYEEFKNA
jgi:two-component system, NtrC family, nitrogen regulation response regulator NtrX